MILHKALYFVFTCISSGLSIIIIDVREIKQIWILTTVFRLITDSWAIKCFLNSAHQGGCEAVFIVIEAITFYSRCWSVLVLTDPSDSWFSVVAFTFFCAKKLRSLSVSSFHVLQYLSIAMILSENSHVAMFNDSDGNSESN